MFQNAGKKVKTLAVVAFWIGIIAAIFGAIGYLQDTSSHEPTLPPALFLLITIGLFSYIYSLIVYAFGELVETSCERTELARETAQAQAETNRLLHLLLEDRKGLNAGASGADDAASPEL